MPWEELIQTPGLWLVEQLEQLEQGTVIHTNPWPAQEFLGACLEKGGFFFFPHSMLIFRHISGRHKSIPGLSHVLAATLPSKCCPCLVCGAVSAIATAHLARCLQQPNLMGTCICPKEVPVAVACEGLLPLWDFLPLHHFLFVWTSTQNKEDTRKAPLSSAGSEGNVTPLPAPQGFSANLSHPWDTGDLSFPSVLFSAWWVLVSLVLSELSISCLWCFSGCASAAAILGQAGDESSQERKAQVPGQLWTGRLS